MNYGLDQHVDATVANKANLNSEITTGMWTTEKICKIWLPMDIELGQSFLKCCKMTTVLIAF